MAVTGSKCGSYMYVAGTESMAVTGTIYVEGTGSIQ